MPWVIQKKNPYGYYRLVYKCGPFILAYITNGYYSEPKLSCFTWRQYYDFGYAQKDLDRYFRQKIIDNSKWEDIKNEHGE
jgi:hypothetical protein